ncbi:hypothetical protein N7G274_007892 [Stereocaulon virgatum]|uniref:threonine--tRNA ligase n=1 Tax=Stereocaulon virgatum TaxID=373712 RepID=A0ABR3ZZW7_9LECA
MRPSLLLRPLQKTRTLGPFSVGLPNRTVERTYCECPCSASPAPSSTTALQGKGATSQQGKTEKGEDHRTIGTAQHFFTSDSSSPGTPFFHPDGTHIFQKLTAFIRAQYPDYGFREVLTPTIYKDTLWKQSGHWDNYRDDMFAVTGNTTKKPTETVPRRGSINGDVKSQQIIQEEIDLDNYALKPMNCPGHCLLYKSKRRSYRDLPLRYAEFSPLHRNEISGALSGLTRVRRFHQDDGHIFCRPSQIKEEVLKSLQFVRMVYETLHFCISDLRFFLSTRPKSGFIGTEREWAIAEDQLWAALDSENQTSWTTKEGDGAFYGPKIDIALRDKMGKEHQTATIQLDFQLPQRFGLEYEAPAPELEAQGLTTDDPELRKSKGLVAPVMIHRAVLGSLERFIALLLEHDSGKLPFWLSPRQVIILTVTNRDHIIDPAKNAQRSLSNAPDKHMSEPRQLDHPRYIVDLDDGPESIAQKIVTARKNKYNLICVMGERNLEGGGRDSQHMTFDVEVNRDSQPNMVKTWDTIESIRPGSQAPRQKDRGVGRNSGLSVRLKVWELKKLIESLSGKYL